MARLQKVKKVLFYTLFLNIGVAIAKIAYGYIIDSISMVSDGFHSFFDGTSNIIGLVGIYIASQPPDENHPYGHRKFETLSTIAIAVLIFFAGFEILKKTYHGIRTPHVIEVTFFSFLIMGITLLINIIVMTYETRKGHELHSDFLLADAMHTKADLFISLSVILSLIAAKAGFPIVDILASLVITFFIAKMGFSILKSATEVLTDAAQINPDEIRDVVIPIEGIRGCHGVRTRGKTGAVNIDLHILVDPEAKTQEAHDIAHSVEEVIKKAFPSVIDVVVHTEPFSRNHKDECPPPS
jgi:cation diffusion facilitator family transporter